MKKQNETKSKPQPVVVHAPRIDKVARTAARKAANIERAKQEQEQEIARRKAALLANPFAPPEVKAAVPVHGLTRKQRRAAEREAAAKAKREADQREADVKKGKEFAQRMLAAKQAKVIHKLEEERGVKIVALPTEKSKRIAEQWRKQQEMRRMRAEGVAKAKQAREQRA